MQGRTATVAKVNKPILAPAGCLQHGPGTEDQQSAQIGITSSGDVPEAGLATGGVLPRYQAKPGGELPAVVELMGTADTGDDRRGSQWPNPAQCLHLLGTLIAAGETSQLAFVLNNALVEYPHVGLQVTEGARRQRRQLVEQCRQATPYFHRPLWQDMAELGEQAADPVERRGAFLDKALAYPVQCQYRLLLR